MAIASSTPVSVSIMNNSYKRIYIYISVNNNIGRRLPKCGQKFFLKNISTNSKSAKQANHIFKNERNNKSIFLILQD